MATKINYYVCYVKHECYVYTDAGEGDPGEKVFEDQQLTIEVTGSVGNQSPIEENGYYRIRTGTVNSGTWWIHNSHVTDLVPNTTTTTDTCTAPTSVTLNTSTKVLTITGGKGGDLNTFQGYQVSWRDAAIGTTSYGSWSSPVTVSSSSTTATYTVTAPAGYVRQFRARTIGSAGSSYYSAYVTCGTTLTGNTAPGAPTFKLPADSATTRSQTPVVVLTVPADADGDTLTLYRKIDSGSWTTVKTLASGTVYDQLPTLAAGSHTVYYKLADSYAESSAVSRTFTVQTQSWSRAITTGGVISNANISHVADINEMLAVLNAQRTYYGLSTIALTGTVGRFGDWKAQMDQMITAVKASGTAAGKTLSFATVPTYPTASVINEIRTQLTTF